MPNSPPQGFHWPCTSKGAMSTQHETHKQIHRSTPSVARPLCAKLAWASYHWRSKWNSGCRTYLKIDPTTYSYIPTHTYIYTCTYTYAQTTSQAVVGGQEHVLVGEPSLLQCGLFDPLWPSWLPEAIHVLPEPLRHSRLALRLQRFPLLVRPSPIRNNLDRAKQWQSLPLGKGPACRAPHLMDQIQAHTNNTY